MNGHVAMIVRGTKSFFEALSWRVTQRFCHGLAQRQRVGKAKPEDFERSTLLEKIPAVTYVLEVGSPSGIVYCSPQIEAMLGYSPRAYEGDSLYWIAVLHPDDRERVLAEDARVGSTGEPFDMEYRCVARDGRTVWVHDRATITRQETGRPRLRQGIMLDVTSRKALEERLEHQAFHDPLTDLGNRALFMDRLEHALAGLDRNKRTLAVLFLDLDDFKRVNDSLGHETGDQLLVAVAGRLRTCVRPSDTVARLGGDEFALLMESVAGKNGAAHAAGRIVDELGAPFDLEGRKISIGASIGVALGASSQHRPGDLLAEADLALYEAKRKGKARYEIFEAARRGRARAGWPAREEDLRRALDGGELTVHYQPKVALETGGIVGAEALVRWEHPERGLLRPGDFFPLAEKTGLIVPIGRWVLAKACEQAAGWQARYPHLLVRVSVNLCARQLRQPELVGEVEQTLRETGLEPSALALEVTERVAMDGEEFATLRRLKNVGVQLEIDDFGAGYFSLPYLERLPADSLKVDCSIAWRFGGEAEGEVIVSAAAGLAYALGREIVAEGVETDRQVACVRELGFSRAQGLYFAGSLPSEEVSALLAAGAPTW